MIQSSWRRIKFLAFKTLHEKTWLRHLILALFSTMILLVSIPIGYILILGNERLYPLLWRYGLAALVVLLLSGLGIRQAIFQHEIARWHSIFLIAAALTIVNFMIQTFLLHGLGDPLGIKERVAAQGISILLYLAFGYYVNSLPRRDRLDFNLISFLVAVLFPIQWICLSYKLRWIKPILALYPSLFLIGLPLLVETIRNGWNRLTRWSGAEMAAYAKGMAVGFLLLLAFFFYQAALKHANELNIDRNSSDQAFYIKFIKDVYQSGFRSTGDHNRMPLYPYLQAFFYRDGMSDEDLFQQGKLLNILLSLALLAVLFLIFLKRFPFYQSFLLTIIVAFSLFIFKAPYVQAEILFFFLAAISFSLMLQMLLHPSWSLAILTGLAAGLAYLTKGTILPGMFWFILILGVKQVAYVIQENRRREKPKFRFMVSQLSIPILSLVFFLMTIYPYIHAMKQKFGNYFYNVNTTVYIWYDNFDQALAGEAKYHFTEQWPANLAEEDIPSLQKYLKDHSFQQIVERFWNGMRMVFQNVSNQLGVNNYWLTCLVILLIAVFIDWRNAVETERKYPYLSLFILLFFGGYLIAFSWYSSIAGGRRFLFSLYIPFLEIAFFLLNQMAKIQLIGQDSNQGRLVKFIQNVNILLTLVLIYDVWLVLTRVLFFGRVGS